MREALEAVPAGCTHVAMESTGIYWRPVFNLLEGAMAMVLVRAPRHRDHPFHGIVITAFHAS